MRSRLNPPAPVPSMRPPLVLVRGHRSIRCSAWERVATDPPRTLWLARSVDDAGAHGSVLATRLIGEPSAGRWGFALQAHEPVAWPSPGVGDRWAGWSILPPYYDRSSELYVLDPDGHHLVLCLPLVSEASPLWPHCEAEDVAFWDAGAAGSGKRRIREFVVALRPGWIPAG